MPIHAIQRSGSTVQIVIDDALTERDLDFVCGALALGPRGAEVTIDLRRARTMEPSALLALSRALEDAGARFELVGLTRANERLLRYLGPGAPRTASAAPRPSRSGG
jgi:hypothetical protein